VIFALYNQPSTRSIPGSSPNVHRAADWQTWLSGGMLSSGQTSVGMQALVDAIRAAGATQIIAAPSFHDSLGFQGFGPSPGKVLITLTVAGKASRFGITAWIE
jgi:hypothetical protein